MRASAQGSAAIRNYHHDAPGGRGSEHSRRRRLSARAEARQRGLADVSTAGALTTLPVAEAETLLCWLRACTPIEQAFAVEGYPLEVNGASRDAMVASVALGTPEDFLALAVAQLVQRGDAVRWQQHEQRAS